MGPSYDRFRALTSQLKTTMTKLGIPTGSGDVVPGNSESDVAGAASNNGSSSIDDVPTASGWRKRRLPNSSSSLNLADSTGSATTTSKPNAGDGPASAVSTGFSRSTRRSASSASLTSSATTSATTLNQLDEPRAKVNSLGFPIDQPLNKEGYRYILVEPDKHAPGKKQWLECEQTAGKPIPGIFYRPFLSPKVVLSISDRATHLKIHESQMQLTGDKGYCMCRATHSVNRGSWYFEATITDQPEGSATRIGWSQMFGNLQAPCGYDKFSYSWRSRLGTAFHNARGHHYADEGYAKGDVIGCLIQLPSSSAITPIVVNGESGLTNDLDNEFKQPLGPPPAKRSNIEKLSNGKSSQSDSTVAVNGCLSGQSSSSLLPESYKDRPLIKFRNSYYFEERDDLTRAEKQLKVLPESKLSFYRNGQSIGVAFSNIHAGSYYPTISIYRSATVTVNFGPIFEHPPKDVDDWQPLSDRVESTVVEQALSDLVYLVANDGFVDKMLQNLPQKV